MRGLENWPGGRARTYRLRETHISTGSGRRTALMEFEKARVMIVGRNFIELRSRFGAFRAYIQEEDIAFVRGYIQGRVPPECEVREEASGRTQ